MFSKKSKTKIPQETHATAHAIARYHIESKQYEKAKEVYESIPGWYKDKKILLNLTYIAQLMKQYQRAIGILKNIKGWENDFKVLMTMAHCYEETGQFNNALHTYGYILHQSKNEMALFKLAFCYQNMGLYLATIHVFQLIPNWQTKKTALLGLAHCYDMIGDYTTSINTFLRIPNWTKDKDALLGLAHCHARIGQRNEANLYYRATHIQDPNCSKSLNDIRKLVFKPKPRDSLLHLEANETAHLKLIHFEITVCLLWEIQWMVLGYPIHRSTETMLCSWNLSPHLDASKVRDVIKMQHTYLNQEQQTMSWKLLKHYGLEDKLNTQTNTSHSFFEYYNPATRKGLSACALEKTTLLNKTHSEMNAHMIKHYKHLPHIEALDLSTSVLNCKR